MKYFTPQLWASWQKPGSRHPLSEADPFVLYRAELEGLRNRLPAEAFDFFAEADVHDGELLEFRVIDGSRPAPLGEPGREWSSPHDFPVVVCLSVLDGWDKLVWSLRYSGVRRVAVDYSGDKDLFPSHGGGFGDWGYHELTDAGTGFLRHEVLFASGSILLVEFRAIEVVCEQARKAACYAYSSRSSRLLVTCLRS